MLVRYNTHEGDCNLVIGSALGVDRGQSLTGDKVDGSRGENDGSGEELDHICQRQQKKVVVMSGRVGWGNSRTGEGKGSVRRTGEAGRGSQGHL